MAAFGLMLVGCSGGGAEEVPRTAPQTFPVQKVCGGIFPDEGAKAVERILESKEFQVREARRNPDVAAVARTMEDAYRSGKRIREQPQSVCEVVGTVDRDGHVPRAQVMFTAFSKYAADPADLPGLPAGAPRVAGVGKGVDLSFDCVSPRVGATRDVPLQVTAQFSDFRSNSKGPAVLGQDYLAAVHAAALTVAKELGCLNDAGIPAQAGQLAAPEAKDASSSPGGGPSPSS
ncbi:hypothetical protein ABT143_26360 [Streptomyces sp. NPDC002033]|uniref:hypothetical protein n=1 Tax=unclassified Streptomyces TaxID=2593676 RepID=UPI00332963D4